MPLVASPGTGYADYQTFGNYDSSVLWQTSSVSGTPPVVSPVMNMTKYLAVAGYFLCTVGICQVTMNWYADPLLVFLIASRTFTLTQSITSGFGGWVIPNMGAYLQVTFSNIAGGNYAMNALAFGTNRIVPLEVSPQNSLLIDEQGASFAPGGTLLYPPDYYAGPATIFGLNATNTGGLLVAVQTLDGAGVWDSFTQVLAGSSPGNQYPIIIPLGAWRLSVNNQGAGNQTAFIIVTPTRTGSS